MGDRLATWAEKWGLLCPFPSGSCRAGSPCNKHNVALADAYLRTKCYPDPSSCLSTIDMSRNGGAVVPLSVGESWVLI